MSTVTTNGVRVEISKSAIVLDEIKKGENQKAGTLTAQLRQKITTKSTYPSKKVDNNLQDSLFSIEAFGFEGKDFTSEENRVAWIPVPEVATKDQVQAMLDKANANGACIYKVLSNAPILTDDQKYAIQAQLRTMDDFANAQVVRYPENTQVNGVDVSNQLVLDKAGNVQYRRTFFSATSKEDIDQRDANNIFMSMEIAAELEGASVLAGQKL